MSFKVNYSDVIICNRALARLPEAPISQMNAPGVAARECRQHYKAVVRRVLTMHDWGIATKIEPLAASPTNLRNDWAFCYEAPSDLAYAIEVVQPEGALGSNVNYFYAARAIRNANVSNFKRSEGKIYCNIADARLVYTSLDVTEDMFTEDFVETVERYLGSKLAMPITKRQELADSLENKGDEWVNRAIALYRGQQGETYGDEVSETELVRQGLPVAYSDQVRY